MNLKTVTFIACVTAFVCQPLHAQGRDETLPAAAQRTTKKIDRTGVAWVLPFSEAVEKARKEDRLLAIKMIAFGTNASGCW